MSKIKVLHPITRLIVGGAQENTLYTAARLDPARYSVAVVCGPQTGSEGSLHAEAKDLGVRLVVLPALVREISPWKDMLALWGLYYMIKKGKFEIVHTHSSKAGLLGRMAAWLAGVRIIVHTVHGWSFHERMGSLRRQLFILLERTMARLSDALIVVAARDREKGLAAGIGTPEQYHLVRSAIPLEAFTPGEVDRWAVRKELGIPAEALVVGNVGRLSPQKNPLEWVRIAAMVYQSEPGCWFLLVGDGPLRSEVERLAAQVGIEGRLVFTGLRRDVDRMMAAMDVFLLTSLWEGLPRVLPQAFAMGIPAVCYGVDGTLEAVEPGVNGLLNEPGDLDKMAQDCLTLLRNPDLRQQMGVQGQRIASQEFDLGSMIEQIETIYEALLWEKGLGVGHE
jgi:glycosyltransferase involved in cell wall biosynthesis